MRKAFTPLSNKIRPVGVCRPLKGFQGILGHGVWHLVSYLPPPWPSDISSSPHSICMPPMGCWLVPPAHPTKSDMAWPGQGKVQVSVAF